MSAPAAPPPAPRPIPADGARPVALSADALTVRLGGRLVLDRVSLALAAGEWTAVVGPNGAGKSTLLSALAGLRRPDAGTVRLQARPIGHWPARERARTLAWLSQHGEADGDLRVHDLVMLGRLPHHGLFGAPGAADHAAVAAALRETDCGPLAERRLTALSGGERQRVLLARAFATAAPVLLLDEPTTHLDAPHQQALLRGLRARADAGGTVVAVLHDLTLALCADRLLVLRDGMLQADGPPAAAEVRDALVAAAGGAIRIERIGPAGGGRWVAFPSD
jgi:iron complex transport system ATP-binding protein